MVWERLGSRELHRGGPSVVRVDRVAGPAGPTEMVLLDGPAIGLVVPVLADGRIVLVHQHRYAWGRASWECPAGHLDPGESPEAGARRELAEETGYRAATLEPLGAVHASAKVANVFHLFRATGLTPGPAAPDPDEALETRAFSPADLQEMIGSGAILHSPSIAALCKALHRG